MPKKIKKVVDTGKTTNVALDPSKPNQTVERKVYKLTVEEDTEIIRDVLVAEKAVLEARIADIDVILSQITP